MIRLLMMRAAPLALRPASIMAEGLLVEGAFLLVLVLPVAMMALKISSIPVHLDYFRVLRSAPERAGLGRIYVSALSWITLAALGVLALGLWALMPGFGALLAGLACLTFLIEKLADEISRAFEFQRRFTGWLAVQSLRATWPCLAVGAYLLGAEYALAFAVAAAGTAGVLVWLFVQVTGLGFRLDRAGLSQIRQGIGYLPGNFIPALLQQGPRLFVAQVFPTAAHLYMVIAQLAQGVGMIFNVRFLMPYRKPIARHTRMFERRTRGFMRGLGAVAGGVAVIWLAAGSVMPQEDAMSQDAVPWMLAAVLAPVLLAESLAFSVMTLYLEYARWLADRGRVYMTYLGALSGIVCAAALVHMGEIALALTAVPALAAIAALVTAGAVYRRHLRARQTG